MGHITSAEYASVARANIKAEFTIRNAAAPGTGIPEDVEDTIFHPANIVASKLKYRMRVKNMARMMMKGFCISSASMALLVVKERATVGKVVDQLWKVKEEAERGLIKPMS